MHDFRIAKVILVLLMCMILSFRIVQDPATVLEAYLQNAPSVSETVPSELPALKEGPGDFGWSDVANLLIASFAKPDQSHYLRRDKLVEQVTDNVEYIRSYHFIPYRVWDILREHPNGPGIPHKQVHYFEWDQHRLQLFEQFYGLPKPTHEAFYAWVKPSLKQAYTNLSTEFQDAYFEWVTHAAQYCEEVDFEVEAEYFRSIQQNDLSDQMFDSEDQRDQTLAENPFYGDFGQRFYYYRPDNTLRFDKKMETALVRVYMRGMPANDIKYWVTRFYEDMEAWSAE